MTSAMRNTNAPLPQSDPTVPMKKVVRVAVPDADAPGLFGKQLDEQSPSYFTYGADDFPSCGKLSQAETDLGSMSWATTALGSMAPSEIASPESSMDLSFAVGSFRPDGFDMQAKKVLLLPDDSPWIESQEVAAPPGLTKPVDITATLSPGSEKHILGTCDPCVWYWKPEGCTRGNDCGYCHLCPEGEIKKRKKQKKDSIRRSKEVAETILAESRESLPTATKSPLQMEKTISEQVGEAQIFADSERREAFEIEVEVEQPESTQGPGGATVPQWSEGSALHGTGQCEPCAWFWGKGCMRGQECLRCHLCPEGELKKRKKAKVATLRKGKTMDDALMEPQKIAPPPGLEAPPGLSSPEKPTLRLDAPCLASTQLEDLDGEESPDGDIGLVLDRVPEVSEGAKYHASGNCRPCAWFWRPMGCKNGEACCHCHLCPPGELKARKKMKVMTIRQEKQFRKEDQDAEAMNAAVDGMHLGPGANASLYSMPMIPGVMPPIMPSSMQPSMPPGEIASAGSADHPYNCKPCAWFHKPKGCENGKDCRHCHLCPEREIQNRRKLKQAILRHQKDITEEQAMLSPLSMGMPMPGALEQMQMAQMAQWGEMQWMAQQMQHDGSPVNASPWDASYSPASWMSPMMVNMGSESEDQHTGEESPSAQTPYQAEKSPKVALDLSTSLTPQNCKQSAGPSPMGGSPRVVKIAQMLCV